MKNLKKFYEFFDDEDLRAEYEMPYLKGEMPDVIRKDFKMFGNEDPLNKFIGFVLYEFPVLNAFYIRESEKGSTKISMFYASSLTPVDGKDWMAQLTLSFYKEQYHVITIIKEVNDNNKNNWKVENYQFDKIRDSYYCIKEFLEEAKKLNVFKDEHNFNVSSN